MAIPSRQIGWDEKNILLWEISKKLDRLTKVWGNVIPFTTTTTSTTTATPITIADVEPYFTGGRMAYVSSNNVYTDLARTDVATDGDEVRSITELIDSDHLQWMSSENRKSYLNTIYGSRYTIDRPIFKNPSQDIPHIFIPNVFDEEFAGGDTLNWASPNTAVYIIRNRLAIGYEGLAKAESLALYDEDSYDHYSITNSGGDVELADGSGVAPFDKWVVLWVEDNGTSTRLFMDEGAGPVQVGSNVTLGAALLTKNILGSTDLHVNQMDFAGKFIKDTIFSDEDRADICTLLRSIFNIGDTPALPWAEVTHAFDGVDTFVPTVTYHGSVAEDTAAREFMWVFISIVPGSLKGDFLDSQCVIAKTPTLIRSDHPSFFVDFGDYATTNAEVACYVKVYDTNGASAGWIPSRSAYVRDEVVGTPSGVYAPVVQTITILEAEPDFIRVQFSGNINAASLDYSGFTLTVNGIDVSSSMYSVTNPSSSSIRILTSETFAYDDEIILHYETGTIEGTNGKLIESFTSGVLVDIDNEIPGPVTVKANLTRFTNSTSATGWTNVDVDWTTTGTKAADLTDTLGNASGISLSVTDAFPDIHINTTTVTNADIPADAGPTQNISVRSPVAMTGGASGNLVFGGMTPGQTVDINAFHLVDDDNFPDGGTGNLAILHGGGTTNDALNLTADAYVKITRTGLTADGSGNVTLTYTNTGGSGQVGPFAVWITKYP